MRDDTEATARPEAPALAKGPVVDARRGAERGRCRVPGQVGKPVSVRPGVSAALWHPARPRRRRARRRGSAGKVVLTSARRVRRPCLTCFGLPHLRAHRSSANLLRTHRQQHASQCPLRAPVRHTEGPSVAASGPRASRSAPCWHTLLIPDRLSPSARERAPGEPGGSPQQPPKRATARRLPPPGRGPRRR